MTRYARQCTRFIMARVQATLAEFDPDAGAEEMALFGAPEGSPLFDAKVCLLSYTELTVGHHRRKLTNQRLRSAPERVELRRRLAP